MCTTPAIRIVCPICALRTIQRHENHSTHCKLYSDLPPFRSASGCPEAEVGIIAELGLTCKDCVVAKGLELTEKWRKVKRREEKEREREERKREREEEEAREKERASSVLPVLEKKVLEESKVQKEKERKEKEKEARMLKRTYTISAKER